MRSGFATSACAAAAMAAGMRSIVAGDESDAVVIDLPTVRGARFPVVRRERLGEGVLCGVIKEASDDPDVTAGLEIQALVSRRGGGDLSIEGGHGVGVVTLPGLPCAVGEAAINPGPRRLIRRVAEATLRDLGPDAGDGWRVEIRVPDGEQAAARTMNARLGIIGGISILGTDGLVRPYSAPAFRASTFYELRVARLAGHRSIGIATGKRSAEYLRRELGEPESSLGVVDVGDELGFPLGHVRPLGIERVAIGGMIGKLSKLAQGRFQTHVNDGEIDFEHLAAVAAREGAPEPLCRRIRTARTAHQVQGWLRAEGLAIEPALAGLAATAAAAASGVPARVLLFSLDGALLGEGGAPAPVDPAGESR